jgi:predicted enzyme related to lactoylglutathione lyase
MPESVSPLAAHPRVIEIVVDCRDPKSLATFWSTLLGIGIKGEIREGNLWFAALLPICPEGPILGFQQVPEGKVAKNRMHLDLRVTQLDQAAARAVDLGGRQLAAHDERGRQWRVMSDPEGNEFCLTL